MVEYELFHTQTVSIMTLLSETARDEIQKVFDCEYRPSHTETVSDRESRLVSLFLFCRYSACCLIFINTIFFPVVIYQTVCSLSFSSV